MKRRPLVQGVGTLSAATTKSPYLRARFSTAKRLPSRDRKEAVLVSQMKHCSALYQSGDNCLSCNARCPADIGRIALRQLPFKSSSVAR